MHPVLFQTLLPVLFQTLLHLPVVIINRTDCLYLFTWIAHIYLCSIAFAGFCVVLRLLVPGMVASDDTLTHQLLSPADGTRKDLCLFIDPLFGKH